MIGFQNIESKTSQAGEYAGIVSDARAVFAEGDIAAVVRGCFNPPMRADRLGRPLGSDRLVGDVESGFAGTAQQSGSSGPGVNETLDLNDGCDMRPPVGSR
jgi:hypothetical protein